MITEIVTITSLAGIFYILLRRFDLSREKKLTPSRELLRSEKKGVETVESKYAELFAKGETLLKEGRFTDAERAFAELARRQPKYPKLQNRLGILYLEKGEYPKAVEAFEQAVREDPSKATRHANLGIAYAHIKKYSLAKKSLEKAVELAPQNEKYKRLLEEVEGG